MGEWQDERKPPKHSWRPSCLWPQPVDCWIGIIEEPGRRVIRVAGRLSASEVPEFLEACAHDGPLDLDLTELVSADIAGIEALQRVRAVGGSLHNVPVYLQMKLDSPTGAPTALPPRKAQRESE